MTSMFRLNCRALSALEDALGMLHPGDGAFVRRLQNWTARQQTKRALAEFATLLKRLGPGDICIDLGANVGEVTQQLAQTGATVHAYEPDPLAWSVLQQNLGQVPNVVLHHAAVAADAGTYRLRRARNFDENPILWTTSSYIVPETSPEFAVDQGFDVQTYAFADVIRDIGGTVKLIKMDIEGSEFAILRQIFADPSRFPFQALFCETHERAAPELIEEVARMRRAAGRLDRPYINLYWP